MIKNLQINNFKSIKKLEMNCKKVNLIIGKPNTGKSNILESLSLISHINYGNLREFVRFEDLSNLFYNENLENNVLISFNDSLLLIQFYHDSEKFNLIYSNGFNPKITENEGKVISQYNYDGGVVESTLRPDSLKIFKSYKFSPLKKFKGKNSDFLRPHSGSNLLTLLKNNKSLLDLVNDVFSLFGFKILFDPRALSIRAVKEYEGMFIALPYFLVSDTLQRMIFYLMAINSNKNSILIFEEPEAHAFPFYTKMLAENIALDENNNQYFLTTHNPYLFNSILQKTPQNELAIFIAYMEGYETKIKQLNIEEIKDIAKFQTDVFFNIDQFLGDD